MVQLFVQSVPAVSPHDAGVRQMLALCARLSYAFMCLTLSWGVFVSTGWIRRLSGREATRNTHMVFATLALAFGGAHAAGFLFLNNPKFNVLMLTVPMADGSKLRWAFGIVGYEIMLAAALATALTRFLAYRRWLWLHRLTYLAVAALVVHSVLGAIANGHLEIDWLVGITLAVPMTTLALVRFMPARVLTGAGLVEEEA